MIQRRVGTELQGVTVGFLLAKWGSNIGWFLPYSLFALIFLVFPSWGLVGGSLHNVSGHLTFANFHQLFQLQFLEAYGSTILLSGLTALTGGLLGLVLSWAISVGGLPQILRSSVLTFSGVASNFAGVPLAFAFTATLGPAGLVTEFLRQHLHFDLYAHGFTLFGFSGLALTYLYFQIPLMVLIIGPTVASMGRWSDAAASLGASWWQYWRYVGVAVLWRPFLGALLLLFGNSFGAYAIAYALTSGQVNLIPILIGEVMSGNVLYNPGFGDAMAVGMLVVMTMVYGLYALIHRQGRKWQT